MLLLTFILSFLAVFYAYFGYPFFLYAANLMRISREEIPAFKDDSRPPLTLIITVRNEEAGTCQKAGRNPCASLRW